MELMARSGGRVGMKVLLTSSHFALNSSYHTFASALTRYAGSELTRYACFEQSALDHIKDCAGREYACKCEPTQSGNCHKVREVSSTHPGHRSCRDSKFRPVIVLMSYGFSCLSLLSGPMPEYRSRSSDDARMARLSTVG
jgi:hypothetical protein